jgi:hypothetical protein
MPPRGNAERPEVRRSARQSKSIHVVRKDLPPPFTSHIDMCPSPDGPIVELQPQSDLILVGFSPKPHNRHILIRCPFELPPPLSFEDSCAFFEDSVHQIFDGDFSKVSGNDLYRQALLMSSHPNCPDIRASIARQLSAFAKSIPDEFFRFSEAFAIGDYWKITSSKVNFLSTSFSPLCVRHQHLEDLRDVFIHSFEMSLNQKLDSFRETAKVILEAYATAREDGDVRHLIPAFQFLRESGLFEDQFVPMFTESVVSYFVPILDEAFQKTLAEYLETAVEIEESEQRLAAVLITDYAKTELTKALNDRIFKSRLTEICERGLGVLIEEHDTKSVDLCAKFARATDTIVSFTREFSFEFGSVVDSCFKKLNPIVEVMKLHRALTDFCQKSFSPQHARFLRMAFEKGFNSSPDLAARLLAEQIHSEFVNNRKVNRQTFEQLISVFRMVNAKDVFEAYHHLLLSRRILMLKNHIVNADRTFLQELTKQCGPEYVKRFNTIFEDLDSSLDILKKFKQSVRCLDTFHALVLSREAWPSIEPRKAAPPQMVEGFLTTFTEFYGTQASTKKLQWSLDFSRVKLQVKNAKPLREVKSNGVIAIVLLTFNVALMQTAAEIAHRKHLDISLVEEVMKLLQSKKSGRLVVFMHHKYRVNYDVTASDGVVSIPFSFPTLPKTDDTAKASLELNRGNQIDAVSMIVMKQ